MNLYRIISLSVSTVALLMLTACTKLKLKREVKYFYNYEITLPNDMEYYGGEKVESINLEESRSRIIVWIDSTECGPCRINDLPEYKALESFCINLPDHLDVVFIFSPYNQALQLVENVAASSRKLHDYPIYIDTANMFAKLNPCIPANKLMHSFLLDATNRVVLVGNPMQNQAMFDLYKKTIDEMLN